MTALFAEPLELTTAHAENVIPVGAGMWRVTDRRGVSLGNIQAVPESLGLRYHARRFHAPSGSFQSVGAFWSPDEALACLRYSR